MRSDAPDRTADSPMRPGRAPIPQRAEAVAVLDEAFAKTDWCEQRRDSAHADPEEDLAAVVRTQLAALAEQSQRLTGLLSRLESTRRG